MALIVMINMSGNFLSGKYYCLLFRKVHKLNLLVSNIKQIELFTTYISVFHTIKKVKHSFGGRRTKIT